MTKRTKLEKYEEIKAILMERNAEEDLLELAEKEIASLSRRKETPRKPSKADLEKKKANDEMTEAIYNEMLMGGTYSVQAIKDMFEELAIVSPQKIASLMKPLIDNGSVVRTLVKKATIYVRVA